MKKNVTFSSIGWKKLWICYKRVYRYNFQTSFFLFYLLFRNSPIHNRTINPFTFSVKLFVILLKLSNKKIAFIPLEMWNLHGLRNGHFTENDRRNQLTNRIHQRSAYSWSAHKNSQIICQLKSLLEENIIEFQIISTSLTKKKTNWILPVYLKT